MPVTRLLLERRLRLRHIGRDRCFVRAQIAEQRASVREPWLDQAPHCRHGRYRCRCNGRSDRDNRRNAVAIDAETRAAIHGMTPAEARTPAPSPIVADEVSPVAEDAAMVETGVVAKADMGEVGVVAEAAADAGRSIRGRERSSEAEGRSRDRDEGRTFQHSELLWVG